MEACSLEETRHNGVHAGQGGACAVAAALSVVVPVFGGAEGLEQCLSAIRESECPSPEIIVVDDGSPAADAARIAQLAARFDARLITQQNSGAAAARNHGARAAGGEFLAFVDADVVVHPQALEQLVCALEQDPGLAAVFGSYDNQPAAGSLVSDYRNLLHHHVHQVSSREASTFWAGCGAIRRAVFEEMGGFSESYSGASIEDVELGVRLSAAGHRIELRPEIQATHLKAWTLGSFLWTDIVHRAIPWTQLLLERPSALTPDLNLRWSQRLSAAASWLMVACLFTALRAPWFLGLCGALSIAVVALNFSFFRLLLGLRGPAFALSCVPLHMAHYLASGAGLAAGLFRAWQRRDRWGWVAVLLLSGAVFAVQLLCGTYAADFGRYSDEPSHFVTGVMASEYLRHPTPHPMAFAEQYYLHYPKVGLGQWPPLLYFLEGIWFLWWGGTRVSALILSGIFASALLIALYVLIRRRARFAVALAVPCLLLCAAPTVHSVTLLMADTLTALFVMGACAGIIACLDRPGPLPAQFMGWMIACAMLTKGNAAPVMVAPFLAILLTRRFSLLRRVDFWAAWLPVLLLAVPWYLFALRFSSPNYGALLVCRPELALRILGFGRPLLVFAAAGACFLMRRKHSGAAAMTSVAIAFVLAPVAMAAFNESRHYMPGAAACAVLAGWWLAERRRPAVWLAGAFALTLLIDARMVVCQPARFRPLASRLQHGEVVMVSGSGKSEGALIAALAELHPRPSIFALRASRVLAESDWNGRKYKLLVATGDQTLQSLERYGVTRVITVPEESFPHDRLLAEATGAWRKWTVRGIVVAENPAPPAANRIELYQHRLGRLLRNGPL